MSKSGGEDPLDQDFTAYLKTSGLFPWVTACIDAIAKAAASVPYKLMRGSGDDAEEVTDHPLLDLLDDPNPEQGWFEFAYGAHQYLGHTGEAIVTAVSRTDRGDAMPFVDPAEFWTLRPDHMGPVLNKQEIRRGKAENPILRWEYTSESGARQTFPTSAIVHAKMPNPTDPIRGLSPLKRLECSLNLLWAALQANKSYLQNGAHFGNIFRWDYRPQAGGGAEATERQIEARHQGASKRGRDLHLYGKGVEILGRLGDSAHDAQYIELFHMLREWVLAEFKCPPFALGLLEHANWSNSVEQQAFFYNNAVIPQNRLLFDAWNTSPLVQAWDEDLYLVHDYSGISALSPNKKEQAERLVALKKAGVITPNEAREELELEPVEGGDELATSEGLGDFMLSAEGYWPAITKARELHAKGDAANAADLRWKAFDARVQPLERAWERVWRRLFRELAAQVEEEANRRVALHLSEEFRTKDDLPPLNFNLDPFFSAEEIAAAWHRAIEELASRTFQRGAEDMVQEVEGDFVPFPIDDPRIRQFIDEELTRHVRTIAENRLDELSAVIQNATGEGVTLEELQTRIREHFRRNAPNWARRIARTETAGLYNRGAVAGMEDAGVSSKTWLSSRDTDVRESHVEMDGMTRLITEDFVFPSGGRGPFPGQIDMAKENINCRCTVIPGGI